MSFFIRGKGAGAPAKKRKFQSDNNKFSKVANGKKKAKSRDDDEESIGSTDEEFAEESQRKVDDRFLEGSEEEQETAQEKRLRLAKKYLAEIEEEEKDRAEFEEGAVKKRLQEEYLEEKGRLRKFVASKYSGHSDPVVLRCKEHKDSITCICLSSNGHFLYSGSKDGTLVKWNLQTKVKEKVNIGRRKEAKEGMKNVQCLAVSADEKFLVAGDVSSKNIEVYSGKDLSKLKSLQGHRGSVTGLIFRKDTHTLYSAAEDRSIKVWNLDDMAYVESLFGHQSAITSIDALARERAISSGGFDGTIRIWKIVEESQLIFNGHKGSIDMVKLVNEEHFLSCGDDGQLCLWGCLKKKPLCSVPNAHGFDALNNQPMWISSIAALINTDLVASGSQDGKVKVWKCGENFRSLDVIMEIELTGFVNSLAFTADGKNLIAAVGKEHRLGRWWKVSEAKNSIVIIPLLYNNQR